MAPKTNKPDKEKAVHQENGEHSEVMSAISTLTDAVLSLVKKLDEPKVAPVVTTKVAPTPVISEVISTSEHFPIPLEYTNLVETILNKKFKIEISYPSSGVGFDFNILVPLEYSNAGEPHWNTYHEDRRSKIIQNAFGVNGVREYVTQVYENFPMETKNKITFDRGQHE